MAWEKRKLDFSHLLSVFHHLTVYISLTCVPNRGNLKRCIDIYLGNPFYNLVSIDEAKVNNEKNKNAGLKMKTIQYALKKNAVVGYEWTISSGSSENQWKDEGLTGYSL